MGEEELGAVGELLREAEALKLEIIAAGEVTLYVVT